LGEQFDGVEWMTLAAICDLSSRRQWVCWRNEPRNGKNTKVPYQANGLAASSTNSSTWNEMPTCFTEVVGGKFDGLGYVLAKDDCRVCIDLDHCIRKDGTLEPWAAKIVSYLDSYTEISPSGDGLHIWVIADLDFKGRRKAGVEIYNHGRYMTVTSKHWEGTPSEMFDRTGEIEKMIADFDGDRPKAPVLPQAPLAFEVDEHAQPPAAKFAALLTNSKIFQQSWEHLRRDMKDQSLSSYDMSLATLAVYAEWDDQEIVNLIIAHRRDNGSLQKGLRGDYLQRTVNRAREAPKHSLKDYEAAEIHRMEEARGADPDESLSELSTRLGLAVSRVVQRGQDPAFYYLETEHGEIHIGSPDVLLSQARTCAAVMGKTRLLLARVKTREWLHIVQLVLLCADQEELGEGQRATETQGWVDTYFRDQARLQPETKEELADALAKSPESFIWEDQIYLRLSHFSKFLFNHAGVKCPASTLGARLAEIGWFSTVFSIRSSGRLVQVRAWIQKNAPSGQNTPI
jgi:hypothetical protein